VNPHGRTQVFFTCLPTAHRGTWDCSFATEYPAATHFELILSCAPIRAQFTIATKPPKQFGRTLGIPVKCHPPLLFWIDSALAWLAALLAIVTSLFPDWLEQLLPIDPDRHSGSVEWSLVVACALAAAWLGALAVREWRRERPAA
jgi:hypothetical protein